MGSLRYLKLLCLVIQLSSCEIPKSRLVFNEIALQGKDYFYELIKPEIGQTQATTGLQNFYLIVLEDEPLRSIYFADLGSNCMGFGTQDFCVYGSTVTGLFPSNAKCKSVISVEDEMTYHKATIYIVMLLHGSKSIFDLVVPQKVERKYEPVFFNTHRASWHKLLLERDLLSDVAIICPIGGCESLSLIGVDFIETLSLNAKYELSTSVRDVPDGVSLNMCQSSEPFNFVNFTLGYVTPGKLNDCTNNYYFGFPPATTTLVKCLTRAKTFSSSFNPFTAFFDAESSFTSPWMRQPRLTEQDPRIEEQVQKLLQRDPFTQFDFEACRQLFSYNGKILADADVSFWLHLAALNGSNQCQIRCDACNLVYKLQLRPDIRIRNRQDITREEGILSKSTPFRNTESIKIHSISPVHQNAVILNNALKKAKTNLDKSSVLLKYNIAQQDFYLPTKAYLSFVYVQARSKISFMVHEKLTRALETNDWGFGGTQSNRISAVNAIRSMSSFIRESYLQIFRSHLKPFSVIIDASTDFSNIPYLVVLTQTIVNSTISIQLYGLLRVKRETAAEMFAAVLEQIEKDEEAFPVVADKFKRYLVAVASDNAKVMVSPGKSMFAKFKAYTGRDILQQGCTNHNLELAFEKALKPDTSYMSDFNVTYWEEFLAFYGKHNEFYNFYLSRGNRRWQHFRQVCDELNIKCIRFKQYLNIRWSGSHFRVLEAIDSNNNAIIKDLNYWMTIDTAGNNEKFGTALYNTITNVLYALVLRDQMDYLEIFRRISLNLQRRNLLVDVYKLIEQGIDDLVKLKKHPGVHLSRFLAKCTCPRKCSIGNCRLDNVENCRKNVKCDGNDYVIHVLKLYKFREELIEQIYGALFDYFDIEAYRGFRMFDVKIHVHGSRHKRYMPAENEEEDFKKLCSYLHIKTSECISMYYSALINFLDSHGLMLQELPHSSVSETLLYVLKESSIELQPKLKSLFETLVVLPAGSAEAERLFSFMNIFKSKRRFHLSPDTLQNLLNLRINGPDVEDLDIESLVEYYLKSHSRTDAIKRQKSDFDSDQPSQHATDTERDATTTFYEDDGGADFEEEEVER